MALDCLQHYVRPSDMRRQPAPQANERQSAPIRPMSQSNPYVANLIGAMYQDSLHHTFGSGDDCR